MLCRSVWGNLSTRLLHLGCVLNVLHVMSTVLILFRLGKHPERAVIPSAQRLYKVYIQAAPRYQY